MSNEINEQIRQLSQQVIQLYKQSNLEQAIKLATQADNLARQHFGQNHPLVATTANNLAFMQAAAGNTKMAAELYHQALLITGQNLGDDHPDYASTLKNLIDLSEKTGDLKAVANYLGQLLAVQRRSQGESHADTGSTINRLAQVHQQLGNFDQAEAFYLRLVEIDRREHGEMYPAYTTSLNSLADLYQTMGRLDEAERLYEQILAVRRKVLGEHEPAYANSLSNMGLHYYQIGDYAAARPFLEQAAEIFTDRLSLDHPNVLASLQNLAGLCRTMGDYAAAASHLERVIHIQQKAADGDPRDFIQNALELALLYHLASKSSNAVRLLKQLIEITGKQFGSEDQQFNTSFDILIDIYRRVSSKAEVIRQLNNLADEYHRNGEYVLAVTFYRRSLALIPDILEGDDPALTVTQRALAKVYHEMGNYRQAETLLRQELAGIKKTLGQNNHIYAESLNALGSVYEAWGDYGAAGSLYEQALTISRAVLPPDHPNITMILNNVAGLHLKKGHYGRAKSLFEQLRDIALTTLSPTDPELATSLNNLAYVYSLTGNYVESERFYKEAHRVLSQTLPEHHPKIAGSLNNLALLYFRMGNYDQVIPLLQQANALWRQVLGPGSPAYADSLNNMATLLMEMDYLAAAEPLLRHSLTIRGQFLGKNHPAYAQSLHNLAALFRARRDDAQAEPYLLEAINIRRAVFGDEHPLVAVSLSNLAGLYTTMGRTAEALAAGRQAVEIDGQMIGQIFSVSSEQQRLRYVSQLQRNLRNFISLVAINSKSSDQAVAIALDTVLQRKGIGAEALAIQRDLVLGGRYPQLTSDLQTLTNLRLQIAQKYLAGPENEDIHTHRQRLSAWNAQKERLEAKLAGQIPEMNLSEKMRSVNRYRMADSLPDDSALVEFVRLSQDAANQSDLAWQQGRYIAFVLHAKLPDEISLIDLQEAEPINQMIAAFRGLLTGQAESRGLFYGDDSNTISEDDVGQKLYQSVFEPLLPALKDCRRLFLAPDGDLSRLPFEILPAGDGHRLIKNYRISYLNVGRDLLRFGTEHTRQPTTPMVVADPDFDLAEEQPDQDEPLRDDLEIITSQGSSLGDRRSKDLDRTRLHFSNLSDTRIEGQQIARMLGISAVMGDAAVEKKLKTIQSPRILHIASHGFFLPDQKPEIEEARGGLGPMPESKGDWGRLSHAMENPLLRSGLALAGANTWLNGGHLPPDAEDGLLTAEDVSGMDLLDTDLVVLSACETGLGQVQVGEGVFGLCRTFMLAGAKTLVISLWKVPDRQTRELMVDFYRRILTGTPCAEALRLAQLMMAEKYDDPLYWGAFICQGDPGPLEGIRR